jgi:hypothetical protein
VGSAGYDSLTEQWSRPAWSNVPSPEPGTGSYPLYSVSALSASDVWVASQFNPIIAHWNGKKWLATSGAPPTFAMDAISDTSVWAAGPDGIAHWNGSKWASVSTLTLLSRGVAQVIEQGLVLFCFTRWFCWLSCRRAGRVVFWVCSWVRS